ncbi:MAG: hypothetical protein HY335_04780 [Deinococcus sp.]|nr:hypothetical protein [Deinococcus sp.]
MKTVPVWEAAARLGINPCQLTFLIVSHHQSLSANGDLPEALVPTLAQWLGVAQWEAEPLAPPPPMTIESDPVPRRRLLRQLTAKLLAKRKIGESHTQVVHAYRAVPAHLRGEAKLLVERLLRAGYLLPKPTEYGFQISLAPAGLKALKTLVSGEDLHVLPELWE